MIILNILLFFGFLCIFIGFYMKSVQKYGIDWNEEFVIFLNEKNMFWMYQKDLIFDLQDPIEFVTRIVGYNKDAYYWAKLNASWLERVKQIKEEMR